MRTADVGFTTAIASLPGVGPARLRVLLSLGPPSLVWERLGDGSLRDDPEVVSAFGDAAEGLVRRWSAHARSVDPAALAARHADLGIRVLDPTDDGFPAALRDDIEPPSLLWVSGDLDRIAPRVVAIVGTRRCTRYGHDVARRFGRAFAEAGVTVVSGLALGIDAAAHAGVLDAGARGAAPLGVVGTGLDVVYPRRNRSLWAAVAEHGVLLSESPPGATAEPWRFPARNRMIAALAELVIVVESTDKGGSLYTVDEALARDVEVRAVPGPVTAPTSAGTNRLLADGAAPALDTGEILESLGIAVAPGAAGPEPAGHYRDPEERSILDVLTTGAATLDELAERTGLSLGRLGLVAARLQVEGVIVRSGGWYERAG